MFCVFVCLTCYFVALPFGVIAKGDGDDVFQYRYSRLHAICIFDLVIKFVSCFESVARLSKIFFPFVKFFGDCYFFSNKLFLRMADLFHLLLTFVYFTVSHPVFRLFDGVVFSLFAMADGLWCG